MTRLAAILTGMVLLHASPGVNGQEKSEPGVLDFFITDRSIWQLSAADLQTALKPHGCTADPKTGEVHLGQAREMMQRQSRMFADVPVFRASLAMRTNLDLVTFDLLPPPNLAKTPTKPDFRKTTGVVEEWLGRYLNARPQPHPFNGAVDKSRKASCQRWIGREVQAILTTVVLDSGSTFKPEMCELIVGPAEAPGRPSITKAPAPLVDRNAGTVVLDGIPAVPQWPGSHVDWGILEQALGAIGKTSDRNAIRQHVKQGASWPVAFVAALHRICLLSGAKANVIVPCVHDPGELPKLQRSCDLAAKKLGKNSPEVLQNLIDLDPEVLRLARNTGPAATQFTTALKQALAAGRPLFWLSWTGIYPENPPVTPPPRVVIRLIIGYAERDGEIIFADAAGKPGIRMKAADALAESIFVAEIVGKDR